MKKHGFLLILCCLISTTILAQKKSDDFSGKWKADQDFIIQIVKKGDGFEGTILEKNKVILSDIKFVSNQWKGTLIRPKDGKKMNCSLKLLENQLKIQVKQGLVSKTLTWIKQ